MYINNIDFEYTEYTWIYVKNWVFECLAIVHLKMKHFL